MIEKTPLTHQTVDAALPALLRQVFGSRACLVDWRVEKERADYFVLIVRLSRPSLGAVVKLAYPQSAMASDFERVAAVYRFVAEHTDIRMPEIWAVDTTCQVWPWRYMIKEYLPGRLWAEVRSSLSPADTASCQRQIGQTVAQIHHIRFPAYGSFNARGEVGSAHFLLPALQDHARKIIGDERFAHFFLEVLDRFSGLFNEAGGANLVHEDLHAYNLLFQRAGDHWRLATILDFDKAWAGPAESDLARLDLWQGMTSPSFWEAYRAERPLSPQYLDRRPIYQLLWCLEYADPGPRHRADTRAVCEQLGVSLPWRFE